MLRKTLGAASAALLGFALLTTGSIAQDATPAADCATTTSEENVEIVQQYIDAVVVGDSATADGLLSDDFIQDLSLPGAEVANDPGNADELSNIGDASTANAEVVHILGQDDWVVVDMEFDLTGEDLGLAAADQSARVEVVALVRIECGMIAEAQFTTNLLEALLAHGYDLVPPAE